VFIRLPTKTVAATVPKDPHKALDELAAVVNDHIGPIHGVLRLAGKPLKIGRQVNEYDVIKFHPRGLLGAGPPDAQGVQHVDLTEEEPQSRNAVDLVTPAKRQRRSAVDLTGGELRGGPAC